MIEIALRVSIIAHLILIMFIILPALVHLGIKWGTTYLAGV